MTDLWCFQWGALSLFLFFGFLGSVWDFKTRRVSNHLVFAVLLWTIGFLFLETLFKRADLPAEWPKFLLIHLALCGATSSILWYRRIWPAGDAKIFLIFSALIVLVRPWLWGFPYWICLDLMINVFLPAAFFILLVLIYRKSHEIGKISMREWVSGAGRWLRVLFSWLPANRRVLFTFMGNMLIIPAMIQSLYSVIPNSFSKFFQLTIYIFFYLFWGPIYSFLEERYIFFIMGFLLIEIAHKLHESVLALIYNGFYFSFGFMVFSAILGVLSNYLKMSCVRRFDVSNLSPGDILSDSSWSDVIQFCSRPAPEYEFRRYADGLSKEDIEVIQSCCSAEKEVVVCETRPFAFWIFFGALWTLFANQTFPRWLISFWKIYF